MLELLAFLCLLNSHNREEVMHSVAGLTPKQKLDTVETFYLEIPVLNRSLSTEARTRLSSRKGYLYLLVKL